jgi:hypothetical protein
VVRYEITPVAGIPWTGSGVIEPYAVHIVQCIPYVQPLYHWATCALPSIMASVLNGSWQKFGIFTMKVDCEISVYASLIELETELTLRQK